MIYLDNAATSLIKPVGVENAVVNAMRSMASPGRGAHAPAMRAAETVFECREAAARLFKVADAENVVFTMNATHALNIAIRSVVKPGSRVLVSGFEHNSVTRPLRMLTDDITVAGSRLFDEENTLSEFDEKLRRADAVICTHVSNAFGYILPVYEIAALCRRAGVPLIVDASQSAGVLDVDFARLGAAFVAMPGHKGLFGPQGTGILLCGADALPLMSGGSGSDSISQTMPDYLPDRLEAGTHNVCGVAGLLAGIKYVSEIGTDAILAHERALLARMKYITRWSLMHSTRAESLSEHTCDTALLAHMLCLIARRYTGTPCRPKTVAVAALYHDAPEIITGDMPTPVKYSSPTLRDAYKALETESVRCMTGLLPDELSEELSPFISGELLTAEEKRLLKAADRLSALIKCTEEQRSGNHEFDAALAQQKAALQAMHCPEADWFIEHCLPCYTQNLDELTRQQ